MRNRYGSSVVLSTLMMIFLVGCSHRPNDETIAKGVQGKVAADPDTKDVSVAAKDGKVTLTGSVQSPEAQQKAEQMARSEGATGVDDQTTVAPPPPPPQPIVVPSGTVLTVKTTQTLGSKISQTGQTFLATIAQPISAGGNVVLPVGATTSGTVVSAKEKGKIKGEGQLVLTLASVSTGGHTYPIQTNTLDSAVKGKGKRTAVTTGGGAAGGALIGGLAGGGKGAGIGALVGAGAGFVTGAFTGNKQIEIPAETPLSFTLTAPLTLPPPGQ